LLVGVLASLGFQARSTNFVVEAPTPQLAQEFAQLAEKYRREKALQWLGQEMPPWPQPCPVQITVTRNGPSGATSFAFDRGRVLGQHMHIEGPVDRLRDSVLPHEVTHTVFAYYFRCPLPRWADEGGAVLSEDDVERDRHDRLCRQLLNAGRGMRLRRLFSLTEYPDGEVMTLYAQGFSVVNYLVNLGNRPTFLGFVATGMRQGWDVAARSYYHFNSVDEMEQAWLAQLRATKRQPTQLAASPAPATAAPGGSFLRQTLPPTQPLGGAPVYRGQAPDDDERYANRGGRLTAAGRRGYLPDYDPSQAAPAYPTSQAGGWQPAGGQPYYPQQPAVRLGPPQPVLGAPVPQAPQLGTPLPGPVSPVGYPN
jgi:hypothetical protein